MPNEILWTLSSCFDADHWIGIGTPFLGTRANLGQPRVRILAHALVVTRPVEQMAKRQVAGITAQREKVGWF